MRRLSSVVFVLVGALCAPSTGAAATQTATLRGKGRAIERKVVSVTPDRFRPDYMHLGLEGGSGAWFFRDEQHEKVSRTQQELAFHLTSQALGLRTVPRLVAGDWNGRPGTLQRVVPNAQRSVGTLKTDVKQTRAQGVDWDSLHALAIQHHVTSMHDDAPYNILVSRAADGRLTYHSIDGERAFGRTQGHPRYGSARTLVMQSFKNGPRELSDVLRTRLHATDVMSWRRRLDAAEVPPHEIERAAERLHAVQEHGMAAILR